MNVCRIMRFLALVVLVCVCLLSAPTKGDEADVAVHGGAEVLPSDEVVTKTLTAEEDATITQIVSKLAQTETELAASKEKEVALLEKLTAAARVEVEHATLKVQFDAMAAELAALKAKPAPEPVEQVTVTVKDPATEAELAELKAQHGRLQEEAAALKQKVAALEVEAAKPAPEPVKEQVTVTVKDPATEAELAELKAQHGRLQEEAAALKQKVEALEVEAAKQAPEPVKEQVTVTVKDPATEAELAELKAQHGRLQEEAAALKQKVSELKREVEAAASAGKPKLSNRKDASAPPSKAGGADGDGSFSGLKELEEFGVFLRGKFDTFMADVYASPTYAQVSASAGPFLGQMHAAVAAQYKHASRFVLKVALPYLRNDLGPQLQAFYVHKVVPFAADVRTFVVRSYTAARPHVVEAARTAHAFVLHTVIPAYDKHMRPSVAAFYTDVVVKPYHAHVKPTVDTVWNDHVAPWYHTNLAPHVATASAATTTFYRTHLRKHVEPVWNTASRHVNKWVYKAADLLDAETLADNASFLLSDVYHLAMLAHETATAAMRRHPTMRAVFGKDLETGISVVEYGVILVVLIVLRPVIIAVLRPVLYVVFSPVLLLWWLFFGGKRVPRPARKAPNSSNSSSNSKGSGGNGARYPDEAYPPSAAGKPTRPPRSSINPQPAGPTFVGSPVPYQSNGDHDNT